MAPRDLQDRAQYLSLALFSQRVVSALMEYVDENRSVKIKAPLEQALDSLAYAKRPTASSQRKVAAFGSYEHLRTLEEVWTETDRGRAVRMIKTVLRDPSNPKSKNTANQLILLFSNLQNQALWNFEQPKPVSPRIMQRLCKLA